MTMQPALTIITRAEYMADAERLHQAYFLSIALHADLDPIFRADDLARVRAALEDGDDVLNTIPLTYWDGKVTPARVTALRPAFKAAGDHFNNVGDHFNNVGDHFNNVGDHFNNVGAVCTLKALAKHLATGLEIWSIPPLPEAWVVIRLGRLWVVPAQARGWIERTPYRGAHPSKIASSHMVAPIITHGTEIPNT